MKNGLLSDQTSYTEEERAEIERAVTFATQAHLGQKRKSGDDFIVHPLAVAATLSRLKLDYETIIAAILHDVLEDNERVSYKKLESEFGETVAFLVESVSKLKDVDFVGEKEELAENFRKMVLATARDVRAVLIKLADVLHNMQTVQTLPKDRGARYAREVLEIYAPLAARRGIGELKGELEDLAFPYVRPKEYERLSGEVRQRLQKSKTYIEKLRPLVENLLTSSGIRPRTIDARIKHLYSLWRKLEKHGWDWDKIYDLVALRIIVDTIPDCYSTLGILHKEWTPLPGRIKDFIALPKPNGYRSLHTTVFAEGGIITEFQIRTLEMHYEAELGIAAHWAYKEESRPFKKDIAWIKQLRDWQHALNSKEFLER